MKPPQPLVISLGILMPPIGCASSDPNTERGAATGAVVGAVGGAVLGNNVGGGGHHALLGAAAGAAAGGVADGMYCNRKDKEPGTAPPWFRPRPPPLAPAPEPPFPSLHSLPRPNHRTLPHHRLRRTPFMTRKSRSASWWTGFEGWVDQPLTPADVLEMHSRSLK